MTPRIRASPTPKVGNDFVTVTGRLPTRQRSLENPEEREPLFGPHQADRHVGAEPRGPARARRPALAVSTGEGKAQGPVDATEAELDESPVRARRRRLDERRRAPFEPEDAAVHPRHRAEGAARD